MCDLLTTLLDELNTVECNETEVYESTVYETLQNIILQDKYESVFTDTIDNKIIDKLFRYNRNGFSKKLMIKYKIRYDIIISITFFLNYIDEASDMEIINKYDYVEQQIIIKALLYTLIF